MHVVEHSPTRVEVRAALLWALEHDRDALLEHREVTQWRRWEAQDANARLVKRWRSSNDAAGDVEPKPADSA